MDSKPGLSFSLFLIVWLSFYEIVLVFLSLPIELLQKTFYFCQQSK